MQKILAISFRHYDWTGLKSSVNDRQITEKKKNWPGVVGRSNEGLANRAYTALTKKKN